MTGSTKAARPQVTVRIRAQESQKELAGTWDEASFSWAGGRIRFQGGWEGIEVTLKGCAEICQSCADPVQMNLRPHFTCVFDPEETGQLGGGLPLCLSRGLWRLQQLAL